MPGTAGRRGLTVQSAAVGILPGDPVQVSPSALNVVAITASPWIELETSTNCTVTVPALKTVNNLLARGGCPLKGARPAGDRGGSESSG